MNIGIIVNAREVLEVDNWEAFQFVAKIQVAKYAGEKREKAAICTRLTYDVKGGFWISCSKSLKVSWNGVGFDKFTIHDLH
jgi:hypothetical protein